MMHAKYFYEKAEIFWQQQDYINAMSRIYYSVLHSACDSLLIMKNINIKIQHRTVHDLYTKYFTNITIDTLRFWQRVRENVDYERRENLQKYDKHYLEPIYLEMKYFI